jgi:hypothetical protein
MHSVNLQLDGRWAPFNHLNQREQIESVLALLQQGVQHPVLYLCCKIKAYLAYGYISMAWRQVRVTFIPKPRKSDYTEAKAYHPTAGYLSF